MQNAKCPIVALKHLGLYAFIEFKAHEYENLASSQLTSARL